MIQKIPLNAFRKTYTIGVIVFFVFSVNCEVLVLIFDAGVVFGVLFTDSSFFAVVLEPGVPFLFVVMVYITLLVAFLFPVPFVGVFSESEDAVLEVWGTDWSEDWQSSSSDPSKASSSNSSSSSPCQQILFYILLDGAQWIWTVQKLLITIFN